MNKKKYKQQIWSLYENYFTKYGFISHQIDSFNYFINHGIQKIIEDEPDIVVSFKKKKITIKFGKVYIPKPSILQDDRKLHILYPNEIRLKNLTYDSPIHVDITEIIEDNDQVIEENHHNRVIIGRTPIMLRSSHCHLSSLNEQERIQQGECEYDQGGYFIVKGTERVLVGQIRGVCNNAFTFEQKKGDKYKFITEIRSISDETKHSVLIEVKINHENKIFMTLPYIDKDIPIGIVLKALGFCCRSSEDDSLSDEKEFETYFCLELSKFTNINLTLDTPLLTTKIKQKIFRIFKLIFRDSYIIKTKIDALKYISKFSKTPIEKDNQEDFARQIVETELFPHLGILSTNQEKAFFIGHLIHKLIFTSLKLRLEDDRDNYTNKRVDVAGMLCCDIFATLFKRYIKNISIQLESKKQYISILNIINKINNITIGLRYVFATGNWGVQKSTYFKTGVSQVLNRLSYGGTMSHLQRLIIPNSKESKNTKMLEIHPSQIFFICPFETPEGKGAGSVLNFALTKKLSLSVPITLIKDLIINIKELNDLVILINTNNDKDINLKLNKYRSSQLKKLLLNGILLGFVNDENKFISNFKEYAGSIVNGKYVSIIYNNTDFEIKILCDESRIVRPVFKINKNINYDKINNSGITILDYLPFLNQEKLDWDELVKQENIVYLDNSEIENSVIAMQFEDLLTSGKNHRQYDYCEIEPSMMFGIMASTVPFPDHSQGPRNCYQCLWKEELVLMGDGKLKSIKDINIGDSVVTVNPKTLKQSLSKVINQFVKSTDKSIIEIVTLSNRKLICTIDHLILTSKGWKQAGMLTTADTICVCPNYSNNLDNSDNLGNDDMVKVEELLLKEYYLYKNSEFDSTFMLVFEDWLEQILIQGNSLFVPFVYSNKMSNVEIADITIESDNHSFITGNGICVHNSSMGKQAIGTPLLSQALRADTFLHQMHYPQKRIVNTNAGNLIGFNKMPSGISCVVALMNYNYNQDDSLVMNKSSIQRGLFLCTSTKSIEEEERKRNNASQYETICLPAKNIRKQNYNYNLLDETGVVKKGVYVRQGDVVVGKILTVTNKETEDEITDCSLAIRSGQEGIIDHTFLMTLPTGYKIVKIVIRNVRIPEIGDKFASNAAQKSVAGLIVNQEDLPFCAQAGIIPDIIMSPLAFVSRMTINQKFESLKTKECVLEGKLASASPFEIEDMNQYMKEIGDNLVKNGYNRNGTEVMYDGKTGKLIDAQIFIGITHYNRLKHLVSDKMHARAGVEGDITSLCRQPVEGRARGGAMRFEKNLASVLIKVNASLYTVSNTFKVRGRHLHIIFVIENII